MRLSELSAVTGVPVATLKYYRREGLVPAGRTVSRTQAEYGEAHVERIRLVRALRETAGLGIEAIARVVAVLDDPAADRVGVMAAAQRALAHEHAETAEPGEELGTPSSDAAEDPLARARAVVAGRGWLIEEDDPLLPQLAAALDAGKAAGIVLDEAQLTGYAEASERIARADLDSVPADPERAVHQVVVGTLLGDALLAVLRRMAQQDEARRRAE